MTPFLMVIEIYDYITCSTRAENQAGTYFLWLVWLILISRVPCPIVRVTKGIPTASRVKRQNLFPILEAFPCDH